MSSSRQSQSRLAPRPRVVIAGAKADASDAKQETYALFAAAHPQPGGGRCETCNREGGDMSDWLNRIEVASPCHESWDEMAGSQRERHCDRCEQTVYDLSGMTRDAAQSLVAKTQSGEQVCVRFRRRADGTVLTADCPTQVRKTRSPWTQARSVAAGLFALAGGLAAGCTDSDAAVTRTMGKPLAPNNTSAPCCDGSGPCCAGTEVMGEIEAPAMMGAPLIAPLDTAAVDSAVKDCEVEELATDEDAGPRRMGKVKIPQRRLPVAGEER